MKTMVGYWLQDGVAAIEPGEGEKVIEVPCVPAGAIAGQVLDADGKPAVAGISISCRAVEPAPGLQGRPFVMNNLRVDSQGRFFVSPLPLGGAYAVVAGRGHNRQFGPAVRLDESRPTGRVTIRLARTAAGEGRVVDPDARPLAGVPVKLEFAHPTETMGWDTPVPTGEDGRFRFDDLSTELDGYRAIVEATRGYQPEEVALRPGGPPVEIRLERGHAITGRVLDAKTGWPIPGVRVHAQRPEPINGRRNQFESEAKTDDEGRFLFSNLPDEPLTLGDRDGLRWESPDRTHVFGVDGPDPIDIRATLPGWSNLKPRAPGTG